MSSPPKKPPFNVIQGRKILVILGPTASGKSALAVKLALRLSTVQAKKKYGIRGAEIISADSRQVYKGLDIGSGKITKKEMGGIPHHLLDVASPKRTFTVVEYQKLGARAIEKILQKKKIPIIVGGTGFYIDALIYGWKLPQIKPDSRIRRALAAKSAHELYRTLAQIDPRRAATIDRYNKRRLVRALEIIVHTGKPVPRLRKGGPPYSNVLKNIGIRNSRILKIGIRIPAEELTRRIKKRLLARIRQGLVREVKNLRARGVSWRRLEGLGLEYRYVGRYLRGLITKEAMLQTLEKEIRNYAKRQMTWFKKDNQVIWLERPRDALKIAEEFLK
ncbi:MAG: tRNA (adenosine(37)-N6)-dimethylallyltransferase MiaA [Candidatus Liptonbacteria bacterium]|nr:tRNA (adenosine(37)-N6)-dimethylallyltransferase MiaA [Candidatus Liptonbacteria bacterium]